MSLPGYARPNTVSASGFPVEIGVRSSDRRTIDWRPLGSYQEAAFDWTWGLEAEQGAFTLHPTHRLNDVLSQCERKCFHVRTFYNGKPWTGRVMKQEIDGVPGRENFMYTCYGNKFHLQRWYAWVNSLFPPEIQFNITGKQDVRIGAFDPVAKSYLASNAIRLNKPIFAKLPIRQPAAWQNLHIDNFGNFDDVIDFIGEVTEPIVFLQARFTQGDDLFRQSVERLELGVSVELWDGRGTSPTVFNTSTLGNLQSVIDYTDDHFLDLSRLAGIGNGLWSNTMDRAGYVFDTHEKRDNRQVQFRTDSEGQIESYKMSRAHADATRVIVGGKSPAILNDIIEIGANLAIQLILNLIAPGLGLGAVVGDLFDDIFFAFQVFWDDDLEDDIGADDAFGEVFADNTNAWSLDAYSVGQTALKEHGGSTELEINAVSGGPNGRGNSFGADNGTARRFDVGDVITFWDRGNTVEQYVSKVAVSDRRDGHMREQVTLGSDKRLKHPWERAISGLIGAGSVLRGIANSV